MCNGLLHTQYQPLVLLRLLTILFHFLFLRSFAAYDKITINVHCPTSSPEEVLLRARKCDAAFRHKGLGFDSAHFTQSLSEPEVAKAIHAFTHQRHFHSTLNTMFFSHMSCFLVSSQILE